jgi:hypothetical protein
MLGYPAQASRLVEEVLELGNLLPDPYSRGGAYINASHFYLWNRQWPACQTQAEMFMALAREYDLGDFNLGNTNYYYTALAYQTQPAKGIQLMRQALDITQARGFRMMMTGAQAALAELLLMADQPAEGLAVIAEAQTQIERSGERYWEAEVWRIRGELLLQTDNAPQAEAEDCYHKAIEVARKQSARSLELRATMSLARLGQQQGKREEARQMLAEIYGWFTEGFDTADLKEARALLDELIE